MSEDTALQTDQTSNTLSICVIRLSAIGDVCNASVTIECLRRALPHAKITWIIGSKEAALIEGMPGVTILKFDKSLGSAAYSKLIRQIDQRFNVLLHMQLSLRANLLALMIPADQKIGFPRRYSRELHRWVVRREISPPAATHVVDFYMQFARALVPCDEGPAWDLPVPEAAFSWVSEHLDAHKPALLIAPAASNSERNWLASRYAAIADYACGVGFDVVVTTGPAEKEVALAREIEALASTKIINLAGTTSLKQLIALCRRVDIVLGPDSGTLHIANSQGTAVVGLYAHSNPARTGPYNNLHLVVDAYSNLLFDQKGRRPSQVPWGTRLKGKHLMEAISVDDVIEKIQLAMTQVEDLKPSASHRDT